jgi:hypothetical protein
MDAIWLAVPVFSSVLVQHRKDLWLSIGREIAANDALDVSSRDRGSRLSCHGGSAAATTTGVERPPAMNSCQRRAATWSTAFSWRMPSTNEENCGLNGTGRWCHQDWTPAMMIV